ncbi:hypothetical protein B0H16DRAFT_787045 [Mycena metata]|uniref:Uncharacterized protein n=1 Tax=Mycena metata TaxID=1033252 RepID=A0AAD7NBC5_9AGAR|nr:hypothetical protein B0H16DRAFT_787045 [Mycena metata]
MPSPAAFSIYAFGLTAFLAGLVGLIAPTSQAATAHLPGPFSPLCIPTARGNALAVIGMGIYYTLAAYQENEMFFALTVPMRLLTTTVFWAQGWKGPAVWEGGGAVVTLGHLHWGGGLG